MLQVGQDPTGGGPPERAMRGPACIAYYSPQTVMSVVHSPQTTTFGKVPLKP